MFNTALLMCGDSKITSLSGRKFWRHPSGMGTVMEFNDGQPRKVLVLDSRYRNLKQFGFNEYGSLDKTNLQAYSPPLSTDVILYK